MGPMSFFFKLDKNRGAAAPLLIVRDESHRLSLGELLFSIARVRFTGCFHATRAGCLCGVRIRSGIRSRGVGAERIFKRLQGLFLQIDVSNVVIHKAAQ